MEILCLFKRVVLWTLVVCIGITISPSFIQAADIPLYGLFEVSVTNNKPYDNPFADVKLNSVFTSPSGRQVEFFGFYDGDGNGGQNGNVWKQRFMPDEVGTWTYEATFNDGSSGVSGNFKCVLNGAKAGPWKQVASNPRWLENAQGEPFLPTIVGVFASFSEVDWQDAIDWATSKGYNTIMTPTINRDFWADEWPNVTPFLAVNGEKEVDYSRFNIKMWREWDEIFVKAGDANLYVATWDGPVGKYGGQSGIGTVRPPAPFVYRPTFNEPFDDPLNIRIIEYWVARQGAYWNLAFWCLYPGEIYDINHYSNGTKVIEYGEFLASITPFGRMITSQDIEQVDGGIPGKPNRGWLAEMNFSNSRKLNTVQVGPPDDTLWQNAQPNNDFAINTLNRGFPVLGTETLWEGQARANKPLRMIWGSLAAGMHTAWADWSAEDTLKNNYISLGHGWSPVKLLSEPQFRTDQLGADTVGDEQLKIATDILRQLDYWRMNPDNELVSGSTEAYCLSEPGEQYLVYAPRGGTVKLDLNSVSGAFNYKWVNPRTGVDQDNGIIGGGSVQTVLATTNEDWILIATRRIDNESPSAPLGLAVD